MAETTIKQRISLEGAEDIKERLKSLGETGEKAFKQIKNAGGAIADGGKAANTQLQAIGVHALQAENATSRFRQALHIAHPVLEEAGLGVSNLRGFSAASEAGIVGLTAAVTGAILLGLAKAGDQVKERKASIEDAYGPKLGPKISDEVRKRALEQGVKPDILARIAVNQRDIERLQGGPRIVAAPGHELELPGQGPRAAFDTEAYFEKISRAHAGAPGAGAEAYEKLQQGFRQQAIAHPGVRPVLTPELFQQLPRPIGNELAKATGRGDWGDLLKALLSGQQITSDQLSRYAQGGAARIEMPPPLKQTVTGLAGAAITNLQTRAEPVEEAVSTGLIEMILGKGTPPGGSRLLDIMGKGAINTVAMPPAAAKALGEITGGPQGQPSGETPSRIFGPKGFLPSAQEIGQVLGFTPAVTPAGVPVPQPTIPAVALPQPTVALSQPAAPPTLSAAPQADLVVPSERVKTGFEDVGAAAGELAEKFRQAGINVAGAKEAAAPAAPAAAAAAPGHASGGPIDLSGSEGGHISGPGTGTSDSILAHLPAGGFVLRSAATKNIGALALDGLRGLATGGALAHLRSPMPKFDDGGGVSDFARRQKQIEADQISAGYRGSESFERNADNARKQIASGQAQIERAQHLGKDSAPRSVFAPARPQQTLPALPGPIDKPFVPTPDSAAAPAQQIGTSFQGIGSAPSGPSSMADLARIEAGFNPGRSAPGAPPSSEADLAAVEGSFNPGRSAPGAPPSSEADLAVVEASFNSIGGLIPGLAGGGGIPGFARGGDTGYARGVADGLRAGAGIMEDTVRGIDEGSHAGGFAKGGPVPGLADGGDVPDGYSNFRPSTNVEDDRKPTDAKAYAELIPFYDRRAAFQAELQHAAKSGEFAKADKALDERAKHPVDISKWNQPGIDLSALFKRDDIAGPQAGRFGNIPGPQSDAGKYKVAELPTLGTDSASDARLGSGPSGDAPPSPPSMDSAAGGEIRLRLQQLASGGKVLARVSNGEYFFGPKATAQIGLPRLQQMNRDGALFAGGPIRGPGTGTSDSILAALDTGGFVLRAASAAKIGTPALDAFSHLAAGGALNPKLPGGVELGQGGPQTAPGATPLRLPDFLAGGGAITRFADGGLAGYADAVSSSLNFRPRSFADGGAPDEAGGDIFNFHMPSGKTVAVSLRGRGQEMYEEMNHWAANYRTASGGKRQDAVG